MEIRKTVIKSVDVIDNIFCDMCGHTCLDKYNMNYQYMTLEAQWVYGSDHDTEEWKAQVCEQCVIDKLEPLIKFFKRNYIE